MARQVPDEPALLSAMMSDMEKADELYRPTKYWMYAEDRLLPELRSRGLHDFRRRKNSVLIYFWATDLKIGGAIRHRFIKKPFVAVADFLNWLFTRTDILTVGLSKPINNDDITPYFFTHVRRKFMLAGLDIKKAGMNMVGNPEDLVKIDGALWSMYHLQHCSMVADAARYIPFSNKMVFCELGQGLGRTAQVLAQLYEDATFILFDIPPQLYVCNQYLKSIFKSRVIDYKEAIKLDPKKSSTLKKIKGKIVVLPSWKMPEWQNIKVSIFWNSASFQEMEPHVAVNYLNIVKKMKPDWIYINALPNGNTSSPKAGERATREPVYDKYYIETLKDKFSLDKRYETDYFLTYAPYFSYIFKKK